MAENVFRALWACLFTAIVIFVVSMFTKPRPVAELDGLVYGVHRSAQGRAGSVLQERVDVGDPGGVHLCGAQHYVLVTMILFRDKRFEKREERLRNMHGSGIPIWFFIGVLLVIYGAMILRLWRL